MESRVRPDDFGRDAQNDRPEALCHPESGDGLLLFLVQRLSASRQALHTETGATPVLRYCLMLFSVMFCVQRCPNRW
jgi:hypothetical protein